MKLRTVSARHGIDWVRQAFFAFGKRPLAFAALFATFLFAVFLMAMLPTIGGLVLLALLPLVSLGFMIATRVSIEGGFPTARVFIDPLRGSRRSRIAILQLGVIYALATFLVMLVSDWVDGGAFEALMAVAPSAHGTADQLALKLAAPGLSLGLLVRFGLAALLAVPFWHAPALIHWNGQGVAQSLFSSTLACWRNRGAFTVYSLTWAGLIVAIGLVGSLIFALFGRPQLFTVAAVPLSLVFTTVFYVSLYFTFADCFDAGHDDADGPTLAGAA